MKKQLFIILLGGISALSAAREKPVVTDAGSPDSIRLGYGMTVPSAISPYAAAGVGRSLLDKAPEIDAAKALYGRIAGLNVYPGSGPSADNTAVLSIHGHAPLVLVDGFPRSLADIVPSEIESIDILTDAAAAALYGVRGANGVVFVTTRRGTDEKLKITARYQYGIRTQFRSPEFADSYTYAGRLNTALDLDGLSARYNPLELDAFRNHTYPYEFPDVDWWNEVYNKTAGNHRLNLAFTGGSSRFRYYAGIDYMRDKAFFDSGQPDTRYSTRPTDTRLSIRTNVDVNLTPHTFFRIGILGKLNESNGPGFIKNTTRLAEFYNALYQTPPAAFPVRYADGVYGGNSVYGTRNPVAMLESSGSYKLSYGTLLADASLKQDLSMLLDGLFAEVAVAFDNSGSMFDESTKEYRYRDAQAAILPDGTLFTDPVLTGRDSEVLSHNQPFRSLYMRSSLQARIGYDLRKGVHRLNSALVYDQQGYTVDGRNNSTRRQTALLSALYSYDDRYVLNGVLSYSGSAYLPPGDRFRLYPAVSGAWVLSQEKFMKHVPAIDLLKVRASFGISGWDGNLTHELWRQSYGGSNAGSYFFTDNASSFPGQAEGDLPVENLTAEKSRKTTFGMDLQAFGRKLTLSADGFFERRSDILVSGANSVSGIIGIGVGLQNAGIHEYKGFDISADWNGSVGNDFRYGIGASIAYLDSKVVNDNQAYQAYDYLYHRGNRVNQCYGLEAIGFFHDQMEINNSPVQTFSTVRPGDIKYKDQNGDNKIDEQDLVKMFGSTVPRFYFGLRLNASYRNFEAAADFQGLTGLTVNLLNSPLYRPLLDNGTVSRTFLDREIPWTPENASVATVPRLTTQTNANNYRANSLWFRDGSFIKLRNLYVAYRIPRKIVRFADMKVYLQGTDLFSLDNIGFADPEQLTAGYPSARSYWMGIKFDF